MENELYLLAALDGTVFAVPQTNLIRILPDPAAAAVPGAPEGICGVGYEAGAVFPIRSVIPGRRTPARLAVLCRSGAELVAFAADTVREMQELSGGVLADARSAGAAGILLLGGEKPHGCD